MPALSKLILLSTLLLSGALSIPVASPGNIGISGSPGFSLTRGSKREASSGGFHGGSGITRGHKRGNTLESIPIAPADFAKREAEPEAAPGGFHGGGVTRGHKREAEAEPGNGFHYGGSFTGGLTRGSKRDAEAEPEAAPGGFHSGGVTRGHKRSANDAELEQRSAEPGNGFHYGGGFTGGLTRGSKREAEAEPGNGFHYGGGFTGGLTRGSKRQESEPVDADSELVEDQDDDSEIETADIEARDAAPGGVHGASGITRGGKREEASEPYKVVAIESVEKREPGNGFHYGGGFTGGLTRGS